MNTVTVFISKHLVNIVIIGVIYNVSLWPKSDIFKKVYSREFSFIKEFRRCLKQHLEIWTYCIFTILYNLPPRLWPLQLHSLTDSASRPAAPGTANCPPSTSWAAAPTAVTAVTVDTQTRPGPTSRASASVPEEITSPKW